MRWLERRRTSRGETLVAVTEEDDLNNSPHDLRAGRGREGVDRRGVHVHRSKNYATSARATAVCCWIVSWARRFLTWTRWAGGRVPLNTGEGREVSERCALTAPDGSAVLLRDGGSRGRSLVSRACGATT